MTSPAAATRWPSSTPTSAAPQSRVSRRRAHSCCGGGERGRRRRSAPALYSADEHGELPAEAVAASLGCGNPMAVADLRAGEKVLDLGSGGGIDVLLSARRVGPTGFAYGVDMTDEMLDLARANKAKAGATNVEFLKGTIEDVPLPDGAVDVVISNCVINLSTDKPAVLAEMFRVLTPGGRIGISDVVAEDHLSPPSGPSAAPTSAASPAPCPGPNTSTAWPRSGSPTPRSPSPTRPPRACTARSSGPPSPPCCCAPTTARPAATRRPRPPAAVRPRPRRRHLRLP